jgi:hypothetical protein
MFLAPGISMRGADRFNEPPQLRTDKYKILDGLRTF